MNLILPSSYVNSFKSDLAVFSIRLDTNEKFFDLIVLVPLKKSDASNVPTQ